MTDLACVCDLVAHGVLTYPRRMAAERHGSRSAGPLRVLIADDYADTAASLAILIASASIETRIATRGDDALAQALRWRPHVCVLDIDMPGCDGHEIARRLRKVTWAARPLLIALTGWVSADSRRQATEAGFDCYLAKPVEPEKLVELIRQHASVLRV